MISVQNLTKYYGDHLAVDDLSFEIEDGHVYGFLGPNGAGKSTTMNIMTGCLSASGGTVSIDGHDIFEEPREAKRLIGYLPEQPPLYLNESPMEYLHFVGEAKGLRGVELAEQIESVIRQTGIESVRHRRISALSKGYKQRVGIAQALLGDPKVIILDEPTVGLDPIQIIEIRDLIRELGKTHTVIFSSHILSEVQAICDRILMIAHGKLAAFDSPENLERSLLSHGEIRIVAACSAALMGTAIVEVPRVTSVSVEELLENRSTVTLQTDHDDIYEVSAAVFRACSQLGITLLELRVEKANLEDVFLELAAAPAEAAEAEESEVESA